MSAIWPRASASEACGSTSLSLAVMISVVMAAARSAPRSEPAKSHDFLPSANPRRARSAALFVRQTRPSSMKRANRSQRLGRHLEVGGLAPVRGAVGRTAGRVDGDPTCPKLDLLMIQIDGLHIGNDLVLVAALGIAATAISIARPGRGRDRKSRRPRGADRQSDRARARPERLSAVHHPTGQGAEQSHSPQPLPRGPHADPAVRTSQGSQCD